VWLDATYLKVRDGARVKSKALVVAVGVNGEGRREMLGPALGVAETEAFWTEFLCELNARGLRGVSLVISDAHSGLKAAAAKTLGATWQRCRVHFMRNALAYVPRKQHQMVAAAIRTAFVQENQDEAKAQWRETTDKLRTRFAKRSALMDEAEDDVLAFMTYPKENWPQLSPTNPLERVNKEIKRRSRVVEIFPNDAALIRLVGAMMAGQSDEWQVCRRYMSQESLSKVSVEDDDIVIEAKKAA